MIRRRYLLIHNPGRRQIDMQTGSKKKRGAAFSALSGYLLILPEKGNLVSSLSPKPDEVNIQWDTICIKNQSKRQRQRRNHYHIQHNICHWKAYKLHHVVSSQTAGET